MQSEANTNKVKSTADNIETQDIEIDLLLEAVYKKYGYDFRNYSKAHIKRRILHRLSMAGISSISELQGKILWDRSIFNSFLKDLSINVTEMFRDPEFYAAFREKVVPLLSTYAHIKIWHAGCSTGEEVYSMAILLREENLLNRVQIYATDFNKGVLEIAKEGIYRDKEMDLYGQNYLKAGGKAKLSDYYTSKYGSVIFDKTLTRKVVFADHNLATDDVFAEVNLILCRNVLIYFDKILQNKVLHLFTRSLSNRGILCLGTKESLRFTELEKDYVVIDKPNKIYRKETFIGT